MSQTSNNALLNADALELWRGDRCLFKELSFAVSEGRVLHVSGSNGSGKTSLLRVLSGLSHPEQGAVRWRGTDIRRCRQDYQGNLAWLGHQNGFNAELTAFENLKFSVGLRRRVSDSELGPVVDRVGLSAAIGLPCRALSAGQKRRLAMAGIMLSGTRLWMLDEPFTNLDRDGIALIGELLNEHCQAGGSAIVAAHQDSGVAMNLVTQLEMGGG